MHGRGPSRPGRPGRGAAPDGARRARSTVVSCRPGRGPGYSRAGRRSARPSMASVPATARHGDQSPDQLHGAHPAGLGGQLGHQADGAAGRVLGQVRRRRSATARARTDGRRSSSSSRPLRSRVIGTVSAASRASTGRGQLVTGEAGQAHGPRARGDHLLERVLRPLDHDRLLDLDPVGQQLVEGGRQGGHVDALLRGPDRVEGHVDVLGQRLRARWAGPGRSSAGAGARTPRCRPGAGGPGAGPAPTSGRRRAGW